MGKIKLTVEGTTVGTVANGGGVEVEKEVSDQDSGRLIMGFAAILADKFKDQDGVPYQPDVQQVCEAWFTWIVDMSADMVKDHEKSEAAKAAMEAVTRIEVN